MNLLPTETEMAGWTTLDDFRQWSALKREIWDCINHTLGEIEQIRHMAGLPASVLKHAMSATRIPAPGQPDPRPLTAAEMLTLGFFWRACRKAVGLTDMDPLTDTITPPAEAEPVTPVKTGKRVKSAAIIDQLDETEVEPLTRTELDRAYTCHIEVTGAEPTHEAEPTAEQLAALRDKIVKRGEAPYADFSIFTLYGRRVQRQMRTRSYVFQPDGSFKATEVPGPSSFQAWTACWRVFKAALYMIRHPSTGGQPEKMVVTAAVMEEYFDHISKLNEEFPEAWHLIMQAEDRCRGEVFERYRRQLSKAATEGKLPMGLDFDPTQPWVGVFAYASRDTEYWGRHVVRPAHTFLARGGKSMSNRSAEDVNVSEDARAALAGVAGSVGALHRDPKRRRRETKSKDSPPSKEAKPDAGSDKAESHSKSEHPKKWGTHYITDYDGHEIRFKFAKGKAGDCGEPCSQGRVHRCQHCLGSHVNDQCPVHVKKSPKGAGKKKSQK